ncbi:MAG: bacterial Ig-like domain-containing protein [Candidatus Merdivicinus sp.]|jgi:glucan-binding YG repeat protein
MKKRLLATVLSIVMVLTMFPVTVLAAKEPDWQPSYLSDMECEIYDAIAGEVEIAAVEGGEMIFNMELSDFSFDNGGETEEAKLLELAGQYYLDQVDTQKILNCLLNDYPYEMFWYDKMSLEDLMLGLDVSTSGNITSITKVSYYIPVYETYQDSSAAADRRQYTLSEDAANRAAEAAAYAQQIVDDNAGKSDQEKLEAYKDIICDLVSYDQETAEIIGNPDDPLYSTWYGDPYQIIHVFDRDPNTNVVAEGYAKAFQYLCDLSDFEDAQCYTVVGNTAVDSTAEDIVGNMYNIVRIGSRSYLVDVCLSDQGGIGASGGLFLATPDAGDIQDGYHFTVAGFDVHYTYASQYRTEKFFPNSVLDLMNQYITGSVTVTGTPKIGETLTAEVEGIPSDAELSYQWYRGSSKIDGATDSTYTPMSEEDVGKRIKVEVSASGYLGTLEDRASSSVEKADAEPVQDVLITSVTGTSITITTYEGEEYGCVEYIQGSLSLPSEWQDSGEFTGLTAGKIYVVFARRKETPTHNATQIADYKFSYATTSTDTIMRVEITVDTPVKYQPLPSSVTVHTANMTASVEWYEGDYQEDKKPVTGNAKPNQLYTARVEMKADQGYSFGGGCYVKVNETEAALPDDYDGSVIFYMNIIFSQPTEPVELESISVTTPPQKTTYFEGEKFDTTGMVVTAYYDDGTSTPVEGYTYDPQTITADTTAVTISYGGKTVQVPITLIKLDRIEVTRQPDKTIYFEGETFDPAGMEITAYYNNGTSKVIEGYTYDPKIIAADTTAVTIRYGGKTAVVSVTAQVKELVSISVTEQPDKTIYYDGDKFDPAGMEIMARYNDGMEVSVPLDECIFTPDPLTEGTTEVTVSYSGKTATVPVTVRPPRVLTEIKITTPPAKTEYYVGESFDPTGMVVTAYYNDGSSESVNLGDCTFAPEEMTLDTTSVTVSYSGKSAQVTVSVQKKELESISVTKQPDKTVYYDGDKFDPTGMEITARYNDGTEVSVPLDECIFTPDPLTEGTTEVTVSYSGKTATVPVTVHPPRVLTEIKITTPPAKTEYYIGEIFDPTGMVVTAYYNDSSSESVNLGDCTFAPEKMTLDTTSVTISYGGMTAAVNVTVSRNPAANAGMSLTAPTEDVILDESIVWDSYGLPTGIADAKVAWYKGENAEGEPVSGRAELSQVYTVKITLTASEDYEFAAGFAATINGEMAIVTILDDGRTAVVTKTFPPAVELPDGSISITDEYFPDEVLQNYLSDNFDTNGDGILSTAEREAVDRIELGGTGLTSLEGIEHFPNLLSLNCNDNLLTELDVSHNLKLEILYCGNNQLTKLDISKNTKLQELACHINQLTELDLSNNPELQVLQCNTNQLAELDTSKNSALVSIRCHQNMLETLDLTKNQALETLECSDNQLTELNVSNCTSLYEIFCSRNSLADLDMTMTPALKVLVCYENQLTKLDVTSNRALEALECADNPLTELDVTRNPALKVLICYENQLTELDVSNNAELMNLNCDRNQLTKLDVTENPELITLDCFENRLTELDVTKNPNLQGLLCHKNQLTKLDLSQNPQLAILYCSNNQLTELDLSQNPLLEILYCYENQLIELDLSQNPNLDVVTCFGQTFTVEIASTTDQKWNFDLSTLLDDWSKVSNVKVQNAVLENDGKTVSWKNGAENPIVQYDYCVDDNDTIITVTLTLNYTPNIPSDTLPYIPPVSDGWKQDRTGSWRYYQDGNAVTGWLKEGEFWYYFEPETGVMAEGWQYISGVWYYLKPVTGNMMTGWQYVNGIWYYLRDWGGMATGWQHINGVWYYLKNWGGMATGWQHINGVWYYLKDWGGMATGWQYINRAWYYLKDWGGMAYNTTIDGYYLGADGAMR